MNKINVIEGIEWLDSSINHNWKYLERELFEPISHEGTNWLMLVLISTTVTREIFLCLFILMWLHMNGVITSI